MAASHPDYAQYAKRQFEARAIMALLAGLFLLSGVASVVLGRGQGPAEANGEPWLLMGQSLVLATITLGLWWWAKRALVPAAIGALAIYLISIASTQYGHGVPHFRSFVIVLILARGIWSAFAAHQMEVSR